MEIGQAQVVRREWYDRNLQPVITYFSASLGPAAETIRASYTVPANRTLQIGSIVMKSVRAVISSTFASSYARCKIYNPSLAVIDDITLYHYSNVINTETQVGFNGPIILTSGYKIEFLTWNTETGSQINYILKAMGLEFDT